MNCIIMKQDQCKQAFAARDKEIKQEKKLSTVKDNKPSDRHTIVSFTHVENCRGDMGLSVIGWIKWRYMCFPLLWLWLVCKLNTR